MDFNTQRKIVRELEKKGRNPLLFLPCFIAKYAVILVMSCCRAVDMALSDKEGRFLGMERKIRSGRDHGSVPVPDAPIKADDAGFSQRERRRIKTELPYRSFGKRLASLALAFAFALMTFPAVTASAATAAFFPFVLSGTSVTANDVSTFESRYGGIYEAQLAGSSSGLFSGFGGRNTGAQAVVLEDGIFNNKPFLTTVTLGYSENTVIGNNFANIAPDSTIFIRADSADDFENAKNKIKYTGEDTAVIWDLNGAMSAQIPGDVRNVSVKSANGGVIAQWDKVESADGYRLYTFDSASGTYRKAALITQNNADANGKISQFLAGADGSAVAVRAYKYAGGYAVFSKKFTEAPGGVPGKVITSPMLSYTMNNRRVNLNITFGNVGTVVNPKPLYGDIPALDVNPQEVVSYEPSYMVVYRCIYTGENNDIVNDVENFEPIQIIKGGNHDLSYDSTRGVAYSWTDDELFPSSREVMRKYVVKAYYDTTGGYANASFSDFPYDEGTSNNPGFATTLSNKITIREAADRKSVV